MILADSNILIDVLDKDAVWFLWSLDQLDGRHEDDVVVNQIVVAEVAPRFASADHFTIELAALGITLNEFGADGAFEAGKAFVRYRKNRGAGTPSLPLPDFFIGGHAKVLGAKILTRDPRFYRSYFPEVPLITPPKDEM